MSDDYVNINGDAISLGALASQAKAKVKKAASEAHHKGYKVTGIAPGSMEKARAQHEVAMRQRPDKTEFDPEKWLIKAKRTAVRSKPYELSSAAQDCARMAEREGWLAVRVVEMKKGQAPAGFM